MPMEGKGTKTRSFILLLGTTDGLPCPSHGKTLGQVSALALTPGGRQVILGTPLREGLRLGVPVPSLTA
jgi:hypothetical protein